MEPCQEPVARKCKIPYTSAAAAVDTLSEPTLPRTGRETSSSQASRHPRAQPAPLRAEHQHHPPAVVGRGRRARGRRPRRRRPRRRGCLASPSQSARLRTRATGRCSTAPAEALQTAGVTSAERRSGSTTPGAAGRLGHAADRAEVVRVLDLVEADHERVVGLEQRVRRRRTGRPRPRRTTPWWSGEPQRSSSSCGSAITTSTSPEPDLAAPRSVA